MKTIQKYSPGPWVASNNFYTPHLGRCMVKDANGVDIAWCGGIGRLEQIEANTRLIAATPKLLASLKTMLALWEARSNARCMRPSAVIEAESVVAELEGGVQ